jgi:hypothetical protein
MRLIDLDPWFIRHEEREETWERVRGDPLTWRSGDPVEHVTGMRQYMVRVDDLASAHGVFFECPKCHTPEGHGHHVQVTFADRGVPPHLGCHGSNGKPTRWHVTGTGLHDLSTTPSILLQGGCNWHGYITNGEVTIV